MPSYGLLVLNALPGSSSLGLRRSLNMGVIGEHATYRVLRRVLVVAAAEHLLRVLAQLAVQLLAFPGRVPLELLP